MKRAREQEPATAPQDGVSSNGDLDCGVCLGLVDEASQSPCCGALYCHKCIVEAVVEASKCPHCRARMTTRDIQKDLRTDRLSAAVVRPCAYAEHRCPFTGTRQEVVNHEVTCKYLPVELVIEPLKRKHAEELHAMQSRVTLLEANAAKLRDECDKYCDAFDSFVNTTADVCVPFLRNKRAWTMEVSVGIKGARIEIREEQGRVSAFVCTSKNAFWFGTTHTITVVAPRGVDVLSHEFTVTIPEQYKACGHGSRDFMTSDVLDEYTKDGVIVMGWTMS